VDAYKRFKKLQNDKMNDIIFRHVFVDERESDWFCSSDKSGVFDYFNTYTDMYFPFDDVTCISELNIPDTDDGDNEPRLTAVTFRNNPSKTVDSKINFHCLFNTIGIMTGFIQFFPSSMLTEEFVDNLRRDNPNDVVWYVIPEKDVNPGEYSPIICSKRFVLKDWITKKISKGSSVNDLIYKRYISQGDGTNLVEIFADKVLFAWLYFAQIVVDSKLFIVEERTASKKKDGSIKIKHDIKPLYRVIDIRTLRTKYFKRDPGTKEPGKRFIRERRRHTRTFRSDYFVNRKGETITIEPYFAGTTEYYDPGNSRLYKVRLDIG